ncbi:MAG: hypothetical protein IJP23_04285 [Oscillospiraceae bacterium]|nr:hypothetical protein [Oscillospiraceae bacterium]
MFRNTAKLLKVFAWIITIALTVAGWFYFVWMAATGYAYYGYFGGVPFLNVLVDLGIAIGATFIGWLLGSLVFAAAKGVENKEIMAREARRQSMMMEALLYRWDVKNPRKVPENPENIPVVPAENICPECSNRQPGKLKFCRMCGTEMIEVVR